MQVPDRTSPARQVLFAGIALVSSVLAVILLAEIAVRIVVPRERWTFVDATDDWQIDPEIGWTNRRNYRTQSVNDSGEVISFETNADGIMPATAVPGKREGVRRIMLFGDSIVLGRAVAEKDRIHTRLRHVLESAGRDVQVLNAAVQGYSTDQSLLLMRRLLQAYRPDVVVYGLCHNDFDGNRWHKNYGVGKPKCEASNGALQGCASPRSEDLVIRQFGGRGFSFVLQRSALYRFLQPRIFAIRARFMNASYAVGLPPELYEGSNPESIPAFGLFEALLTDMNRIAQAEGATFLFYSHPSLEEVWDPAVQHLVQNGYPRFDRYWLENIVKGVADRRGIQFCALIDHFRGQQGRGPFHLLPRDPHCNAAGYATTAEKLGTCIRDAIDGS